jgi:hypothetical protein
VEAAGVAPFVDGGLDEAFGLAVGTGRVGPMFQAELAAAAGEAVGFVASPLSVSSRWMVMPSWPYQATAAARKSFFPENDTVVIQKALPGRCYILDGKARNRCCVLSSRFTERRKSPVSYSTWSKG